jgi:hypothetical protein
MSLDRPITFSSNRYDITEPLFNGSVAVEGYNLVTSPNSDIPGLFELVLRNGDLDIAELGFTFFARTMNEDEPPYYALPVFLIRKFQHSTTFINTRAGITTPVDLAGKTIGEFATFGHDMGVWPKGIFQDEYGLTVRDSAWIVGGVNHPMPAMDFGPLRHPEGVLITPVPEGKSLGPMLESGEISALISALPPTAIGDSGSDVDRLYPDYEARETAYFERTGIFPIMHLVVVKRSLVDTNPGLAVTLYRAFERAKQTAMGAYRAGGTSEHRGTWFSQLLQADGHLVDDGRWDYGVSKNRKAVDTFLRYHHEQGLSKTQLTCEDIFPPELMTT